MGERCRTRYPIVLAHGLLGFVRVAGYFYWHGIDAAPCRQEATVHVVRLSTVHDNEALGEQLLERVAAIRAASGAARVNLIGHSQGGLAARYAAARQPTQIASVTCVATRTRGPRWPTTGTTGCPPTGGPRSGRCPVPAWPSSIPATPRACRRAGVVRVTRTSTECATTRGAASSARRPDGGGNRFDPSHALCRHLARYFVREAGQNDGLVGRFSSHLGKVIRSDYPFDHLDIVNQSGGGWGATSIRSACSSNTFRG